MRSYDIIYYIIYYITLHYTLSYHTILYEKHRQLTETAIYKRAPRGPEPVPELQVDRARVPGHPGHRLPNDPATRTAPMYTAFLVHTYASIYLSIQLYTAYLYRCSINLHIYVSVSPSIHLLINLSLSLYTYVSTSPKYVYL